MKKLLLISLSIITLAVIAFLAFRNDPTESAQLLYTEAVNSTFPVVVSATGELKAKNSIKVRGPEGMRSAGIWQTTIKDLVPEGTQVKKGQFVASLDKTELATKITEIQTEIEKEYTKLEQAKIDTAIQMKEVRDEIADLKFNMAQEELEIQKNRYEPEMVIEQSKLKLENSQRSLAQLENKVDLLRIQSEAKVKEITTNIKQYQNRLDNMMGLSRQFDITAPEDGMVIYENSYNGKKGPGSQVSGWDPVVAELPDLSQMNSIVYVNEVDISKILKGQHVTISVDAFPEKSFTGRITAVANIGQQLRNQEAKVFEIVVEINQKDEVLRPAMTTSNLIQIYEYEKVTNIPLEAYHNDSLSFVLKKVGQKIVKQEVLAGPSNADNIIIIEGVDAGDRLCISPVPNIEELEIYLLSDDIKKKAQAILAEWEQAKKEFDEKNASEIKDEPLESKDFSGTGGMIIIG